MGGIGLVQKEKAKMRTKKSKLIAICFFFILKMRKVFHPSLNPIPSREGKFKRFFTIPNLTEIVETGL